MTAAETAMLWSVPVLEASVFVSSIGVCSAWRPELLKLDAANFASISCENLEIL